MDHTDYINKIQKKYGIKSEDKTKLITLSDYEDNVKKIESTICVLDGESIERIYREIYDTNGNLLWDLLDIKDVKLGQYIMTISSEDSIIEYGYVTHIDQFQIILKPTLQTKTSKSIKIRDKILIRTLLLTRYSDAQLNILKLQKMLRTPFKPDMTID